MIDVVAVLLRLAEDEGRCLAGVEDELGGTPSPCLASGKRLISETFMPCASKTAPRPSKTT